MIDYHLIPSSAMTDEELDRRWGLLVAQVRLERAKEEPESIAVHSMMTDAIHGDPSFAQLFAWHISEKMLRDEALSPSERFFVTWSLWRISTDEVMAKRIGRMGDKESPGRPKNGAKGLATAMCVVDAVTDEGAKSIEEAIFVASTICGLGEDMVKKHWMKWSDAALALSDLTSEALKDAMASNKNSGKK